MYSEFYFGAVLLRQMTLLQMMLEGVTMQWLPLHQLTRLHCVIEVKMKSSLQTQQKCSHTIGQTRSTFMNVLQPVAFLPLKSTTQPFQLAKLLLQIHNLFWQRLHGLYTPAAFCFLLFLLFLLFVATLFSTYLFSLAPVSLLCGGWTLSSDLERVKAAVRRWFIQSLSERGKNI